MFESKKKCLIVEKRWCFFIGLIFKYVVRCMYSEFWFICIDVYLYKIKINFKKISIIKKIKPNLTIIKPTQ